MWVCGGGGVAQRVGVGAGLVEYAHLHSRCGYMPQQCAINMMQLVQIECCMCSLKM